MLSYRLWRALMRPPTRNPVFRRAYTQAELLSPWYVGCVQWAGILIFLPIIALAGLVYGFGWSAGIGSLLGSEREEGTFDLLSLTPSGPLGISWAAALGYLYRHRTFRNVNQPVNLLVRATFAAFVLSSTGVAFTAAFASDVPPLGPMLLFAVTMLVALVVDHVQSLAAAVLVGFVAAEAAGTRLTAQIYAFALYSGVQVATYLFTLGLGFAAFSAPGSAEPSYNPVATVAVALVRLALFTGSRELLIWLLWRQVNRAYGSDPCEQRALLGLTPRKGPL